MTKEECEKQIAKKFKEIVDIYHQYNPKSEYLSVFYASNSIGMNNRYWECSCDGDKPIYYCQELDET